jgi:TfoX/Sxy family transcriptional regulator of competence genes
MQMFGGIAAKVNGHIFAGLFGRSTMIWLPDDERADALALQGAAPFDPMGDGRARSDKIMLPERMMADPAGLSHWVARAFKAAAKLPPKVKAPQKRLAASTNPRLKKQTKVTDVANRRTVTTRSAKRRSRSKGK